MSLILLIKFQHKDDATQAWLPKIVVLFGFYLVFGVALLMPYDVANRDGGGISMQTLWMIALISVAAMVLVIIPFAYCYYEAQGVDTAEHTRGCCERQFMQAFCYTLAFAVVVLVLNVILYATPANTAEVPVVALRLDKDGMSPMCDSFAPFPMPNNDPEVCDLGGCSKFGESFTWDIPVTYFVYLFALLSFIGWWFFFIFAGVGLVALPLDLINDFRTRPHPMKAEVYREKSEEIYKRASELHAEAKALAEEIVTDTGAGARMLRTRLNELENNVFFLHRDYDILKISKEFSKSNPLWWILKLILGILGLVLSIMWILHICLFMLQKRGEEIDPFLNKIFEKASDVGGGAFPLFGILLYAIFVFYLQWAVIKGNFKFGVRVLIIRVFPMEPGKTLMSAFLANLWVLLLCTFPLVQFVAQALPEYARYTAIETLYGGQIRYLRGFKIFWGKNVFLYLLLSFAALTLPIALLCPNSQKKALKEKIEERIRQGDRARPGKAR